MTLIRELYFAFATVMLMSSAIAAQNAYEGSASAPDASITGTDWNNIIVVDQQSVSSGMLPPEVLRFDARIVELMPQAQAILASKDKTRARVWIREMNALMAARSNAIVKFSTAHAASANAIAKALGNGRPDPCLDPMGRDRCHPPSQPRQQQPPHVCGSGPGPDEVPRGQTPAGNGVGAEPLCDWK